MNRQCLRRASAILAANHQRIHELLSFSTGGKQSRFLSPTFVTVVNFGWSKSFPRKDHLSARFGPCKVQNRRPGPFICASRWTPHYPGCVSVFLTPSRLQDPFRHGKPGYFQPEATKRLTTLHVVGDDGVAGTELEDRKLSKSPNHIPSTNYRVVAEYL